MGNTFETEIQDRKEQLDKAQKVHNDHLLYKKNYERSVVNIKELFEQEFNLKVDPIEILDILKKKSFRTCDCICTNHFCAPWLSKGTDQKKDFAEYIYKTNEGDWPNELLKYLVKKYGVDKIFTNPLFKFYYDSRYIHSTLYKKSEFDKIKYISDENKYYKALLGKDFDLYKYLP